MHLFIPPTNHFCEQPTDIDREALSYISAMFAGEEVPSMGGVFYCTHSLCFGIESVMSN